MRLSDLGEFQVLKDILLPRSAKLGGFVGTDCAVVPTDHQNNLVISSDKGNTPLVWSLPDYSIDYQDMGWLTAIAGISDLATNGATPLCATNNIVAPSDFLVEHVDDFSKGFCEALSAYGFAHAGGDLSEGTTFSTSATFIGIKGKIDYAERLPINHNSGRIIVVGELGTFAAGYCIAQKSGFEAMTSRVRNLLCRPTVPYKLMCTLTNSMLYAQATDASDGIVTALSLLANRSGCQISVDLSKIRFDPLVFEAANDAGLPVEVIGFAWGNWQQVLMVPDDNWEEFEKVVGDIEYQTIGTFNKGSQSVSYQRNGKLVEIQASNNEGFRGNSYVATGKLPFV